MDKIDWDQLSDLEVLKIINKHYFLQKIFNFQ